MRKVIYSINLTADGCCSHTKGNANEEVHQYYTNLLKTADLLVYGRKTYELMVPYWPDVAKNQSGSKTLNDFANTFTAIDKVVFSRSLESVEGNTLLLRGNLEEEFLKLKQSPGGNISVGGVELPAQLMALGLIDEYYFVIHPVIAGAGRRLWDDINMLEQQNLILADTETFKSGHIALHYLKK